MKIKQTKMKLELDPNRRSVEDIIAINYDNTESRFATIKERFFVTLPPVVATALGKNEVRAETQDAVWQKFLDAIQQFKTMTTEHNKVILYNFELGPLPASNPNHNNYGANELKVCIQAGIFIETVTTAGDGNKRYTYEAQQGLEYPSSPHVYNTNTRRYPRVICYTERNEAFFKEVKDRMIELVNRLIELESPEKLAETINTGRLLPLGNPEVKDAGDN